MDVTNVPRACGVYLLKHRVTGDTYVGSTNNIRKRARQHLRQCARARHTRRFMQLVESHGADFSSEVLELTTNEELEAAEKRWIKKLQPTLNRKGEGEKRLGKPEDMVLFAGHIKRADRLRLKLYCIPRFLSMERLGIQWIIERLDLEEKAEKKGK